MNERDSSPNLASIQTKYTDRSPLIRFANARFLATIRSLLERLEFRTLLDAGSGEGVVLSGLNDRIPTNPVGLDLDIERLLEATGAGLQAPLLCANLHDLPFSETSFDVVLCLEVLEHVGDPARAVAELHRVTDKYLVASVPNEPWWRAGNFLIGRYWREWGNTPEHINHWTIGGFLRLLSPHFEVIEVRTPLLWTFVLAKPIVSGRPELSGGTRPEN
ncbi:MAG: class I SAM-dependent methyltransferase [Anaerolineales bacterium]